MPKHFGGSFAPPLTDERLAEYATFIRELPVSPVKDAMSELLVCCEKWWDLPESEGVNVWTHQSNKGTIVPLDTAHAEVLYDAIPWTHELEAIEALFNGIDPILQKRLRDAAQHLLWHVKELNLDREPLTNDKL